MAGAKKHDRVTQRDIARYSQVSQATVSRVVAGDARVDATTSDRVRQVMREFNYRPDVLARSLRNRTSNLIGLVVKRTEGGLHDDPFFANLISGIMEYLLSTPYHLCAELVTESSQVAVYDELLRTRRVDGLILVESEAKDERIHRLQADRFPFVLIGNPTSSDSGEIWSVDNDNVRAGEEATAHLIEQGYRRIGMLAGPAGVTVSEDRIAGYMRACETGGAFTRVWHSEFGLQAAKDAAKAIFSESQMPDALVVLDDFMAMGVVMAARSCGVKIPEDIALVSFGDSSLCQVLEGGLSSVSLNIRQLVDAACSRLLTVIEDAPVRSPKRLIVPTELKVRGSSTQTRRMLA